MPSLERHEQEYYPDPCDEACVIERRRATQYDENDCVTCWGPWEHFQSGPRAELNDLLHSMLDRRYDWDEDIFDYRMV
jgi:hypothetical protein